MGSGEEYVEGPSVSCLPDQSWREARKGLEKNLFTLSLESFTHFKGESCSFCNCTVFN